MSGRLCIEVNVVALAALSPSISCVCCFNSSVCLRLLSWHERKQEVRAPGQGELTA